MIRIKRTMMPMLLAALFVMSAAGRAQDTLGTKANQAQADTLKVSVGQRMHVEGVIVSRDADSLTMRGFGGGLYKVALAGAGLKEKKSNPFRASKTYSKADLVQGLQIDVKGVGDSLGAISASEIRIRTADYVLAQTMDARVVPVENRLKDTQDRLGETELNSQRLSGQVRELTAITDTVRDSAKTAQQTADSAAAEAKNASSVADNAKAGVKATNERIASLDDYDVKEVTTVNFKAGSAVLQKTGKAELDKLAESAKNEKGFLLEVAGFASSDGDEAFNRRLSQKRADSVVQYLAENYSIPLRRFVLPLGYGEKQPVANNTTVAGRSENRRVEVRLLLSKGLISGEGTPSGLSSNLSATY